jgi:hypothetical protein
MGHIINPDREYRLLQRRLDRNITGAPDSPVFMKILKLLFAPQEAHLARLFDACMHEDDCFARLVFQERIQIGRNG